MSDSSSCEDEQLVVSSRKHKITKGIQKNEPKKNINTDDETTLDFGKNKRVRIYNLKNLRLVDIRAMYYDKTG